jgi:acetyl/propionyl-CoA carboxylase alpha subunit
MHLEHSEIPCTLFERDCSLQRHYQKMVEEAPFPIVSAEFRNWIAQRAVLVVRYISNEDAGTVEVLSDEDQGKFHFVEMNARI